MLEKFVPNSRTNESPAQRSARVLEQIKLRNAELQPEDRALKFKKMSASPLAFLRGTNHLFWEDLTQDKRLERFGNPQTNTLLQGDLHIENIGFFHNQQGQVVFNFNDFDDSIVADFQYDLWRLSVSWVLAAQENRISNNIDFISEGVRRIVRSYRETLARADLKPAKFFGYHQDNSDGVLLKALQKVKEKESREKMLRKWTKTTDGKTHFDRDSPKVGPLAAPVRDELDGALEKYALKFLGPWLEKGFHLRVLDAVARLQAGTGSIGEPRHYALVEWSDDQQSSLHILDMKLARKPTAYPYLREPLRKLYDKSYKHDAHAHFAAQKAILGESDLFLGWSKIGGQRHLVRERSPYKEDFNLKKLDSREALWQMAHYWGSLVATNHRKGSPEFDHQHILETTVMTGPLGEQVLQVALEYADLVARDWKSFTQDLAKGAPVA